MACVVFIKNFNLDWWAKKHLIHLQEMVCIVFIKYFNLGDLNKLTYIRLISSFSAPVTHESSFLDIACVVLKKILMASLGTS